MLAGGRMQSEHFLMLCRPGIERLVRIDDYLNEDFKAVADLAQIDYGAVSAYHAGLFHLPDPFGNSGSSQMHLPANFCPAEARIRL